MGYANGRLPASALGGIPGANAGLRKDAALAYCAMSIRARSHGVSLAITDGPVGRTYRNYARQLLAKRTYGSNAATPGTSNHGWALAVDLMSYAQRRAVDQVGRPFGFAKVWSDAPWEWWHIRWQPGVWAPPKHKPNPYPTLRRGTKNSAAVKRMKALLHKADGGDPNKVMGIRVSRDGSYGLNARRAVRAFQRKHHLKADGVVGPTTWAALRRAAR